MNYRFTIFVISLLLFLCSMKTAKAQQLSKSTEKLDLLQELKIDTFQKMTGSVELRQWISDNKPELAPLLSSTSWQIGSFSVKPNTGQFWVGIGNRGMWEDLVVIIMERNSNTVKLYHDIDVFTNSTNFMRAHWFSLPDSPKERSYNIFVTQKLKHEQLPLRKFFVMTDLAKQKEFLFAKPLIYSFFTCLLMLFLYNMMLAWRLRSFVHAIYAIHCITIMFFIGLGFSIFYEAALYTLFKISLRDIYLLSGVSLEAGLFLFCYVFLELKYRSGKLWLFLYALLSMSAVVTIFTMYAPYDFSFSPNIIILNKIYAVISLTFLITLIIIFLNAWRRGSKKGFFLFLSQLPPLLILGVHLVARLAGLNSSTWFTFKPFAFPLAFTAEMLIISYAMTDQVRRIRDESLEEKAEIERKMYDILKNQNEKLERLVGERTYELQRAKSKSDELARTDMLTGMNNRFGFFEYSYMIFERAKRYGLCYSVIIIDIDHFKIVNDTYGHAVGDKVIKRVAKTILKGIRDIDINGRIGGEEFAIVLPELTQDKAGEIATQICKSVADTVINLEELELSLSISIGVAQNSASDLNIDQVVSRADDALYQAKNLGRNRVCLAKS